MTGPVLVESLAGGHTDDVVDAGAGFVDGRAVAALRSMDPDRVVHRCVDGALTADTVLRRCAAVRESLRQDGVGRGDVIAVKGRRDSWLLPTLLGVMATGAAYLVVPFTAPAEAERRLWRAAGVRVAVSWGGLRPAAGLATPSCEAAGEAGPVVWSDGSTTAPRTRTRHALDVAYVCATSGTTGTPKCVGVPHRAVTAFLDAAPSLVDLRPDDVLAARSSAAFDLSVWELWGGVSAGVTAVLVTEDVAADIAALHDLLAEQRCTVLSTTPSAAYRLGAHDAVVGGGLSLRRLLVGGEAADGARLEDVASAASFATCRIDNWYGPTEATVSVTGGRLDETRRAEIPVSIGPPLPGVTVSLVGGRGRRGRRGELAVAGDQLAHGYLGDPRSTAAAFVPDPAGHGSRRYLTGDVVEIGDDGWIAFLGRRDGQVQVRGHRVELSGVARLLAADPAVAWAHASLTGADDDTVVAHFTTRTGHLSPDRARLWTQLYAHLPRHAVPAALVEIHAVPETVGQKLDTSALPAPSVADFVAGAVPVVAPRDETERRLHTLWVEILGVDDFGVTHHFFALGGNSLSVARMFTAVRRTWDVAISLADVVDRLTVAELAALVEDRGGEP